jgi:GNAT superfamily N-acetyltransferase
MFMQTTTDSPARPSANHVIRLARPEDQPSIVELLPELDGASYSERFPGKTCLDFVRWKYSGNPAGEAAVGVALDGHRVVSIVAGTPKHVRIGTDEVLAFELGDFITAADHRKRGLFSALINLVSEAARDRGASFVYVRPNDVSFPILESRLGFVEPRKLEQRRYVVLSGAIERKLGIPGGLVRALGVDAFMRRRALGSAPSSITVEPVRRFIEANDRLWNTTRSEYNFCQVRDSSYLNWRYVDSPTPYWLWAARRGDDMAGYLVAFATRKKPLATIVDFFTHPADDEAASALLSVAFTAMLQAGVQVIQAWTLQSGAQAAPTRLLQRACMFVDQPLLHVAMRPLAGQTWPRDLPGSGWHLTGADFDGF